MGIFNPLLATLPLAAGTFLVYKLWNGYKSQHPLPPHPKSYPLIGHLLSVPTRDDAVGFTELGKQLNSDIFHWSVFGTLVVVLNSLQDVINLLEKKSSIYSDRVCPPMLGDPTLMNWADSIALVGYNDRWRSYRRLIHPWLNKQATESFHESQQLHARLLLQRLLQASSHDLESSSELDAEFSRTVASTITHSIYGYRIQSYDDSFMVEMKIAADNGTKAALPSNFLVNIFPALLYVPGWFPGANWKYVGREWRRQKEHAIDTSYGWTKAQIAAGEAEPSIIASLLNHGERLGLMPEETDDYVGAYAA